MSWTAIFSHDANMSLLRRIGLPHGAPQTPRPQSDHQLQAPGTMTHVDASAILQSGGVLVQLSDTTSGIWSPLSRL